MKNILLAFVLCLAAFVLSAKTTSVYVSKTSGTSGQVLVSNGANNAPTWLDSGTSGQVLVSNGPNTAPTWKTPKKWYRHCICMYDTKSWMMNVEFINNSPDSLNTVKKIAAQLKADGHTSYGTCKSVVSTWNGDWMYYGLYSPTGSDYIYTYKKEISDWYTIGWNNVNDTVTELPMF